MARVTGPLMSMTASGTVGKIATFSKWNGQAYVRTRVIPNNLNSESQQTVRSILGTLAKSCRAVLTYAMDDATPPTGSQFWVDAVAAAPSGQSWISYLQQVLNPNFATLVSAYAGYTTVAGYFNTSALTVGLASYTDKKDVAHTAGEQLYLLANFAVSYLGYSGFAGGIVAATQQQCTDFAAYVHDTIT
jgi:hypothetical protein